MALSCMKERPAEDLPSRDARAVDDPEALRGAADGPERPCRIAIRERLCLPLGEFYELILKALRANILQEPGVEPPAVKADEWNSAVRPQVLMARPLVVLFCVGIADVAGASARRVHPRSPSTGVRRHPAPERLPELRLLPQGLPYPAAPAAVYRPHWRWLAIPPYFAVDGHDAIMLSPADRATVVLSGPAVLATAAGIASWHRPAMAFFSLLGLIVSLRPILGGRFANLIQVGSKRAPSDADHSHIFPANRSLDGRLMMLRRALAQPTTWVRMAYGLFWTLASLYWGARLGDMPPWTLDFWRHNGIHIALGIVGSLLALAVGYLSWEIYHIARERARARRDTLRLSHRRWFGAKNIPLDESSRVKLLASSPVLSALQPPQRLELSRLMTVSRHGFWSSLSQNSDTPMHVSLIVQRQGERAAQMPASRIQVDEGISRIPCR